MVDSVAIDYMHGVMLGVVKMMLKLWFSSEYKKKEFNIHNKLSLFDQRLTQIKPPNKVTRPPRSYQKFCSDWKASEYRNFILFYCLPILADILPNKQLSNFTLLVHSIFILLQKSISYASIESAENMLINFCNGFQKIYGDRYMSANIH